MIEVGREAASLNWQAVGVAPGAPWTLWCGFGPPIPPIIYAPDHTSPMTGVLYFIGTNDSTSIFLDNLVQNSCPSYQSEAIYACWDIHNDLKESLKVCMTGIQV